METTNRRDLIERIQEIFVDESGKPAYSKNELQGIIKEYEAGISEALNAGKEVVLTNFLKFMIVDVPEKTGIDYMHGGGTWTSPAHKTVKVKVSKRIKDAVA